ncbi:MAG: hypothetical protein ACUVSK_12350 [Desulfotomaculales bacterium]
MLFASLWLTMEKGTMADDWEDEEEEENEDDRCSFSFLDDEKEESEHDPTYEERLKNESVLRNILNDMDANKLRAYAWIDEGMPIEFTF